MCFLLAALPAPGKGLHPGLLVQVPPLRLGERVQPLQVVDESALGEILGLMKKKVKM